MKNIEIKEKYPNLSIVGIMSLKRKKRNFLAITFLVLALMIYCLLPYLFGYSINNMAVMIMSAGILLVTLKEQIVSYRVKKGIFGQNESEAREIIRFILNNSDNIDFADGRKSEKLISESEIKTLIERAALPQPATA
jgi:hypothetical protein